MNYISKYLENIRLGEGRYGMFGNMVGRTVLNRLTPEQRIKRENKLKNENPSAFKEFQEYMPSTVNLCVSFHFKNYFYM
ncbi:hypothetical protein [Methanobrevibacter filiformis]|uniref:Uncharacterized protein n=1 Tax=Methanobrevibacter filiformis TaxID=55758 RepID=A0A166FF71_9EURY|nr:hypothetical protein [Methanobrevibacter filiformis]KZX17614.1 hypothetical protein MBFIL_00430 [Methanobrevibacter filiformis]